MSQAVANARAPESQWLSVRLGAQEFAIDIMRVRELRGFTELTPVPQSPSYVSGLLDLRGTVIPVVDLALRLDLPPTKPCPMSVIVVVEARRGFIGLLVDQVCDLLSIADHALQFPDVFANEVSERFLCGVIVLDSRIVNVVRTDDLIELEISS